MAKVVAWGRGQGDDQARIGLLQRRADQTGRADGTGSDETAFVVNTVPTTRPMPMASP